MDDELPFTDPPEPHCCGNCDSFDGAYCMKSWNNLDEQYKDKDLDSREPTDTCDEWSGDCGFTMED